MKIFRGFFSARHLSEITTQTIVTLKRFPASLTVAIAGTAAALATVEDISSASDIEGRLLWILAMIFPLAVAVELCIEQRNRMWQCVVGGYALILTILIVLFFYIPPELNNLPESYIVRSLLIAGAFVLLIPSMVRFQAQHSAQHFWSFFTQLWSAFVLSGAVSALLFIGIVVGIGSTDALFDLGLDEEIYLEVWIVVVGLVTTTLFFSQLPQMNTPIQARYPKAFQMIGQYVLLPLMAFYFCILYFYTLQRIVEGIWPEAFVSYMIIGFSLAGIICSVVLYQKMQNTTWAQWFHRILYIAIIPQIGVLLWAVHFPLTHYGITEKRYLVVVFGLWLLGVCVYQLFVKRKSLSATPLSLALIILIIAVGPWSVLSVSQRSQGERLLQFAKEAGVEVRDEKIQKTTNTTTEHTAVIYAEEEINRILYYLINTHGITAIEPYFGDGALDAVQRDATSASSQTRVIVTDVLGIADTNPGINEYDSERYFYFSTETPDSTAVLPAIDVAQYTTAAHIELASIDYRTRKKVNERTVSVNGELYTFSLNEAEQILTIRDHSSQKEIPISFASFLQNLRDTQNGTTDSTSAEKMQFVIDNTDISATIVFDAISGNLDDYDTITLDYLTFTIYFSVKQ